MMTKQGQIRFSGREALDLLIEFSYLAVIFLVPLYFAVLFPTYNVFELNKIVLFKVLAALLLFFTLLKVVFYRPFAPFVGLTKVAALKALKRYWLIPTIFIVGLALTLTASINPAQSFFGSYDRQQGYLSYLFYWLWFILVSFNVLSVSNRRQREANPDSAAFKSIAYKNINRIITVAVGAGLIASLYGILQVLGIDFLAWPEPPLLTHRAFSTFGQPNFFASFLLLTIPLSFYLVYRSRHRLLKFFYLLVGGLQITALFFTASRGALVALALMALAYLLYLFGHSHLSRLRKIMAAVILLLIILAGGFGLNKLLPGRLSGLADLSPGSSVAARLIFYRAALDAWTERPILGYGLDNGAEVFIKYYQPDWALNGNVGTSTDRAHNLFLDIMLGGGLWGLLFFIWLYVFFFRQAVAGFRRGESRFLSLALGLGAGAYLVSLLFGFGFVAGEVYFWLFMAILAALNFLSSAPEGTAVRSDAVASRSRAFVLAAKISAAAFAFILGGFIILISSRDLVADFYYYKLYYILAQGQYFTAFILGDDLAAARPNPVNREYYDLFWGDKLSAFYPGLQEKSVKVFSHNKLVSSDASLPARGYENILVKAKIAAALGKPAAAEKYFSALEKITPHWPPLYLAAAAAYLAAGNSGAALVAYARLDINLPGLNNPALNSEHLKSVKYYKYLISRGEGDAYFLAKDYVQAEGAYQAAYRFNPADFTLFKKIADTYYYRGDLAAAIKYNKQGLTYSPGDYNWYVALAVLFQEKGDRAEALKFLEQGLKLAPDNPVLKTLKAQYGQ